MVVGAHTLVTTSPERHCLVDLLGFGLALFKRDWSGGGGQGVPRQTGVRVKAGPNRFQGLCRGQGTVIISSARTYSTCWSAVQRGAVLSVGCLRE